jgi:intracellular multiplication protein IcmP
MSQQGGGQGQTDQTASFFWYVVLIAIAVILIWFFGKKYLVPPIFWIREGELYLLEAVLKGWNYLASFVHLPLANINSFEHIKHFMDAAQAKEVTLEQVEYISGEIGVYYQYPMALIILALAYISFFRHRSQRFVKTYSMKTFLKAESENWPQIHPILSQDILSQKLDEGPWAMSQLPFEFCKTHNLLKLVKKNEKPCWSIVQGAAERLFVLQMGPLWEGVDKLPIHIKAFLVIFVSRLSRHKEVSHQLIDQIADSAQSGKLNFSGVDELFETYKNHKVVKWAAKRHAYVYTLMATLLDLSRAEGVLASAEFIWLKPLDRRLWYVLNTVGRVTSVVEVGGVYAHWMAEKKLQRGLSTPVVNEAVKALDIAVGEILYTEAGKTWHTSNAA